tara:strand:+ start:643 stop:906 length:264 start_codon:yes stop_codon:yes gene_type:complete
MSKKTDNRWKPLAKHEQWLVEYWADSNIVRLSLGDTTMHLRRDDYQMLWGVITQGLDELERVEDAHSRLMEPNFSTDPQATRLKTRH